MLWRLYLWVFAMLFHPTNSPAVSRSSLADPAGVVESAEANVHIVKDRLVEDARR